MGDDDEEQQPTKYEFSEESKLDEDHLFYLQFTNNFISNVTRPRDFDHCSRWLEKLAGEPMYGVTAKRNRNMYLAQLLVAMQDNKVKGPFGSFPPPGALKSAGDVFGLTSDEEREKGGDVTMNWTDKEMSMNDYRYKSKDGRTYVATSKLQDSGGVMGYLGITYGGGEGLWLNRDGEKVSLTDVMNGDRITTVTTKTPIKEQIRLIESYHWDKEEPENECSDPFMFLTDLPQTYSASNLINAGNMKYSKQRTEILKDQYPTEVIEMLQTLMIESKKSVGERLLKRHNRVVKQLYEGYQKELETSLQEYKLVRQEWQLVMNVIHDIKKVMAETETKCADRVGGNDNARMLGEAYADASERKQNAYNDGKELEERREDMHKVVHGQVLSHKVELEKYEKYLCKLAYDIKRVKKDSRRKQQVIDGLVTDIKNQKMQ